MAKFIKGDKDINRFKNALCKEIIRILLFFQKTKNEDKEIFMNYINDKSFEIKINNIKNKDNNLKLKN
jgi:hypothetical protein